MREIFSLHKINDSESFGFDPAAYSRFKFGDGVVAEKFGKDLAEQFIKHCLKDKTSIGQLVVISSPYSFIPTATFAMKDHFVFALNHWLAENNFPVVQEAKVHRTITYKEDYGELNAEERIKLIGNDSFHIDRGFLEGKTLVFLDDIKITGSHEKMISRTLLDFQMENDVYLLYFAELENKSIHPRIENYLNYFTVKSVFDLNNIINSNDFRINTRLVKYILNSDFVSFRVFIESQQENFTELLYNMALGNGYHTIAEYQENLHYIKTNCITQTPKKLQDGN